MGSKLAAVHALVRADYELISQLGQAIDGSEAYLARERSTGTLVALRVDNLLAEKGSAGITVTRTLDSNLPAHARFCSSCQTKIEDWRRFCRTCGADLSGSALPESQVGSLLEAAVRASDRPLEMLGHMPTTDGGGAVYFGTERNTGQIVAFNFREGDKQQGDSKRFSIHITSTLSRLEPSAQAQAGPQAPAETVTASKVCPACGREYNQATRFCPDDGSVLRASGASESLVGEVIADRYHILAKIGQGGMGQVYLAEHLRIGRRCAIKVLNRSLSNDVDAVNRFSREAANAARINDANVADIYDFGESKDHGFYLAMEYVAGEPLSRILSREAPLQVIRTLNIASQVARGLWAAHRHGIVHRDLTPNNVVIGESDEGETVKIVDFGIAKALQDSNSRVTKTGFVVGTPQYMSPEQLIGDHVDARSDIYQLGCILFEMLTGTRPFANADGTELVTRRLVEAPPRPQTRNANIPNGVDSLVVQALALKREDRYESALAFRNALEDLLWELSGSASLVAADEKKPVISGPRRPDTPPRARQPVTPPAQASASAPPHPPDQALPVRESSRETAAPVSPPASQGRTASPGRTTHGGASERTTWSRRLRSVPFAARVAAVLVLLGTTATVVTTKMVSNDAEPGLSEPVIVPPQVEPGPGAGPSPDAEKASQDGASRVDASPLQKAEQPVSAAAIKPADARVSRGSLVLSGELPNDAVVLIDGVPAPNRNGALPLEPGIHRVRITADGFEPVQDSVRIEPGVPFTYRFSLRQLPVMEAPATAPKSQAENPATIFDPAKARDDIKSALLAFVAALDSGRPEQLRASYPGATEAQITELSRLRGRRNVALDPNYSPPAAVNPSGTEAPFNLFFRDGNIAQPLPYRARLVYENGAWVITQFGRRQ